MANIEQLVVEFVRKDDDLKVKAKALGPIRKERKALYDQAKKALEERGGESEDVQEVEVQLSTGEKVKLKLEEKPVAIKLDYLVSKLTEILGSAPRGEEVANRIWEERPTKPSSKLVREKGSGGRGAAGAGAGAGAGRKRTRA